MMESMKNKLHSRAGESIAETLIALLIGAVSLIMLAGAVSASSSIITRSRKTMDSYYTANEIVVTEPASISDSTIKAAIVSGNTSGNKIEMQQSGSKIEGCEYAVTYYENTAFSKTPVIAYYLQAGE